MRAIRYIPAPASLGVALEVLGLAAIGFFLGHGIWLLFAPDDYTAHITPAPNLPNLSMASDSTVPVDKSILLRVNPFEIAASEPNPAGLDDVPETALNLTLKGQRAVTGNGLGTATIVTPDNRQRVFREGEEILEGVVLSRVLSDRVILEKDGRFESLFWEGRDGALNVLGSATEPRQTLENQEVVDLSSSRIMSISDLLRSVRIERATRPEGWRLRAIGDPSVLRSAGLFDGDYLVSLNGSDAASMSYQSLIESLNQTERANLSVRRGNQTIDVTVVFEERLP